MKIITLFYLPILLISSSIHAQVINEIVVNPNGSDENCEYVEIKGITNGTLINYYFASVEGDSSSNEGSFDRVIDLSANTLGNNGLLVIHNNLIGICDLRTWGAPNTTVISVTNFSMENGSTSFLLLSSPTPIIQSTDYDSNDDGTLELPIGAFLVDSIGWNDGGIDDLVYGFVELPSTAGGTNDMATRFVENQTANDLSAWYHGDMLGTADSLLYDPSQVSGNFPSFGALTPGKENSRSENIFKNGFED